PCPRSQQTGCYRDLPWQRWWLPASAWNAWRSGKAARTPPARDLQNTDACARPTVCCSRIREFRRSFVEARQSNSRHCSGCSSSVINAAWHFNRKAHYCGDLAAKAQKTVPGINAPITVEPAIRWFAIEPRLWAVTSQQSRHAEITDSRRYWP